VRPDQDEVTWLSAGALRNGFDAQGLQCLDEAVDIPGIKTAGKQDIPDSRIANQQLPAVVAIQLIDGTAQRLAYEVEFLM
jgi:hypothetical protein